MTPLSRSALFAIAACLLAAPVSAQAISPPTRVTGGLFGEDRTQGNGPYSGLFGTVTIGAGFDENQDGDPAFGPQRGSVATVEGELRYRRGTTTRFLDANGLMYVNTASISRDELFGGEAMVRGGTSTASGRTGVTGEVRFSYEPTYLFNAFGSIDGGNNLNPPVGQDAGSIVSPGLTSPQGISTLRWRTVDARGALSRNLTPRQRVIANGWYSLRRQVTSGPPLRNDSQTFTLGHAWNFRQNAGVDTAYSYNRNQQDDQAGITQVVNNQTATMTLRMTRPFSPTRQVTVSVGGGATLTEASYIVSGESFVVPVVFGQVRWDPSRAFFFQADARRDVTVLEGVSPEPFATNAYSLRMQSTASRRVQLALSASQARGAAEATGAGAFTNTVGTAQVQVAVSRWCAAYGMYSLYLYRLEDVTLLDPTFPSRYTQHAIRGGLTFWFPLVN